MSLNELKLQALAPIVGPNAPRSLAELETAYYDGIVQGTIVAFDETADRNITGTWTFTDATVNGVSLSDAGAGTLFLADDGLYKAAGGGFDPSADQTITGNWDFTNVTDLDGVLVGDFQYDTGPVFAKVRVPIEATTDLIQGRANFGGPPFALNMATVDATETNVVRFNNGMSSKPVGAAPPAFYAYTQYQYTPSTGAIDMFNFLGSHNAISASDDGAGNVSVSLAQAGTGTVEVNADPTTSLGIATKQYVDNALGAVQHHVMEDPNNSFTGWEAFPGGYFAIDGILDDITSYKQKWTKTGITSNTVECRLIYDDTAADANPAHTGKVFWEGTDTQSPAGTYLITAAATATAVPSEDYVPIRIEMRRTAGGDITSARAGKVSWE